MMDKEPTSWVEEKSLYMPSTCCLRSEDESRKAHIHADGYVVVYSTDRYDTTPRVCTSDLRGLIASLQSILVLAEEHFGEGWGNDANQDRLGVRCLFSCVGDLPHLQDTLSTTQGNSAAVA